MTDDREPPAVTHEPIASAPAGEPLTVRATVTDGSGVDWVRLRYRSVDQTQDYRTLPMTRTGDGHTYEATVPGEHVDPLYDFTYFLEAMDCRGNGCIWPDLEHRDPYVVVELQR